LPEQQLHLFKNLNEQNQSLNRNYYDVSLIGA